MPASFYPDTEIPVLVLRGSAFEMGRQRGELFGEQIRELIDHYRTLPLKLLDRTRLGRSKVLSSFAASALNIGYRLPLSKNILPPVEQELRGVCEGAGIPYEDSCFLMFMPDIFLTLFSIAALGHEAFSNLASPLPSLLGVSSPVGCTSVAAWGSATADGELVVGRNMDFPGIRQLGNPLLVLYEPEDGQRYLSATAAGVPTGGVTGMNESGITVAIHMNFSLDCSLSGHNIMNVANEVVRRARSLDEAVDIALAHKVTTGFTLFITSGDERRAAAVEFSAKRTSVRYPEGDSLVQTNHYLDDELSAREFKKAMLEKQSGGRFERCTSLLKGDWGTIGPETLASYLGDRFDVIAGRERTIGNTVCQPSTVLSVVMVPGERKLYFARNSPGAEFSPASQGPYYGYTIDEIIAGDFSRRRNIITGSTFSQREPGEHRAHELFIESMNSFYYEGCGLALVLAKVEEACAIGGAEPFHHYVKGLLKIAIGLGRGESQGDSIIGAIPSLEKGLSVASGSSYLESYGRFLLGRAHLALGEMEDAKAQMDFLNRAGTDDALAQGFYERLVRARKARRRLFVPGEPEELILEYVGII